MREMIDSGSSSMVTSRSASSVIVTGNACSSFCEISSLFSSLPRLSTSSVVAPHPTEKAIISASKKLNNPHFFSRLLLIHIPPYFFHKKTLFLFLRKAQMSRCMNVFRRLLIQRSEEHTSELQSRFDLVCRLLLEKKKTNLKQ